MGSAIEMLRAIGERFQTSGNVKNVFGDPITVEGKTIIPVARIKYGFGAGAGRKGFTGDNSGEHA
jgi:uncharacterized spore protein YtfJ